MNPEAVPATERILAGFCHDLNGQLTNALGFAYLLGPEGAAGGPMEHLRESLDRIEDLVRQLRWLAREPDRRPEPTSLAELLDTFAEILPHHARFHRAAVVIEGPVDLPAVRVDFASALRILLLAVDAAVPGEDVAEAVVTVSAGPDSVLVHLVGNGLAGEATPQAQREATDAGVRWQSDADGGVMLGFPALREG